MNKFAARCMVQTFPNVTYEQALEKALLYDEILSGLAPEDWTWADISRKRIEMFKLCEAICVHNDLDKTGHLVKVDVIYSCDKGKITDEESFWINRYYPKHKHLEEVKTKITNRFINQDKPYRLYTDLEVVEV